MYTPTFSLTTIGATATKSSVPSPSPAGIVRGRSAVANPVGCYISYPQLEYYTIPGTSVTVPSLEECLDHCASVAGPGSPIGTYMGLQSGKDNRY